MYITEIKELDPLYDFLEEIIFIKRNEKQKRYLAKLIAIKGDELWLESKKGKVWMESRKTIDYIGRPNLKRK